MTSANMLSRVRTLLDESSASFFSDSEIYSALADGQRDLVSLALMINSPELPNILRACLVTTSGTITTGNTAVNLPSGFVEEINVTYNPGASTPLYPCLKREISEITGQLKANTYTTSTASKDYYYSINASQIVFETAATATAAYTLTHISMPSDIASGTQPTLPDFSHNAIVQYAFAFILRKDQREQEAQIEFQKFYEMAKGIMN